MEKKEIYISGVRIDMVQIPDVIKAMEGWIEKKENGNYIVVSNAYDTVANCKDKALMKAANSSSLTVPDGFSLILSARMWGYPLKRRVYGPDLTLEFLKVAEAKGFSSFFYGSTKETLDALVNSLKEQFPNLKISGTFSPPFRDLTEKEKEDIINRINRAQPDVLWVGLGTPKQQICMYEYKDRIKVPVMVGIGAAFDFLAKTKFQAPRFIRDNGFEWLFRLVTEPKRLWKRYLVGNIEFLILLLRDVFKKNK